MARGQEIVLSADPSGYFDEGVIDDTSKPGTLMEMVPNAPFIGGRPHFRASTHADGAKGGVCVLLADQLQGKTATDAYVAGSRCFLYWPQAGEELNLLLGDVAGTGDIVTQGDLFGVASGGKIKRNAAYASAPFQAMESLAAQTADALVWVRYLGNQA